MDNKVKVGVRIRPLNVQELNGSSNKISIISENGKYILTKPSSQQTTKKHHYEYDWAFDENSNTKRIYELTCRPLIENIFDGFNATFFAYGQTSSGKTFTLSGINMTDGVITFALKDIFTRKNELLSIGTKAEIELTYIEIYREECYDLFSKDSLLTQQTTNGGNTTITTSSSRNKLDLKETIDGETVLDGINSILVSDIDMAIKYLTDAAKGRSTGQTAMNAQSSRSHAIFTVSLRVTRGTGVVTSKLHLVDLAGSERAKKTQATGEAFQEGVSINKGLLVLGNVVSALANRSLRNNTATTNSNQLNPSNQGTTTAQQQQQHIHIPYRESKLTRLLKDALGGNGLTVMLACVSPSEINMEETVNTLRFASRTSSIVNRAHVNHDSDKKLMNGDTSVLMKEIVSLKEQVHKLQAQQLVYQSNEHHLTSNDENNMMIKVTKVQQQQHLNAYYSMILAAKSLTYSLRMILMVCLEDNSYVNESELLNIQKELQYIRSSLNIPSLTNSGNTQIQTITSTNSNTEFDIDMNELNSFLQLPPIMLLIEEVKYLEKGLRKLEKETKHNLVKGNFDFPLLESYINRIEKNSSNRSSNTSSRYSGGSSLELSLHSSSIIDETNHSFERSFGYDDTIDDNDDDIILDGQDDDDMLLLSDQMMLISEEELQLGLLDSNEDNEMNEPIEMKSKVSSKLNTSKFTSMQSAVNNAIVSSTTILKQSSSSTILHANLMKEEAKEAQATKVALHHIQLKEAELNRMSALTEKYQGTIKSLNTEITNLENDQRKLTQKVNSMKTSNNNTISNNNNMEEIKIRNQLKEKSKLLEEKIKLLRSKENECNKVCNQKDSLNKEVEQMNKIILEHKQKRVELQRKMKDEQNLHQKEKLLLKQSEIKNNRKVNIAQQHISELNNKLNNKEKVWKMQLEAKERENKQYKELMEKQQLVKAMKTNINNKENSIMNNNSNMLVDTTNTTKLSMDLKLWIEKEIDDQTKRILVQEQLSNEMILRSQLTKKLHELQCSNKDNNDPATTTTQQTMVVFDNNNATTKQIEMKKIEDSIRQHTKSISVHNTTLLDLGNKMNADKKRFSHIIDIKESKLLSEVLFDITCKTHKKQIHVDNKVRKLQEQVMKYKKQLQNNDTTIQFYKDALAQHKDNNNDYDDEYDEDYDEIGELDETFYPSDIDNNNNDNNNQVNAKNDSEDEVYNDNSSSSDDDGYRRKRKVTKKTSNHKNNKNNHLTSKKRKHVSNSSSNEQQGGNDSSSILSDYVDNHQSNNSDDDSDNSDVSNYKSKHNKRVRTTKTKSIQILTNVDNSMIQFPLSQYTVKELKSYLSERCLLVSGVKEELIKRLEQYLTLYNMQSIKDTVEVSLHDKENNIIDDKENIHINRANINTTTIDIVMKKEDDTKTISKEKYDKESLLSSLQSIVKASSIDI